VIKKSADLIDEKFLKFSKKESAPTKDGTSKLSNELRENPVSQSFRIHRRISRVPLRASGIQEHFKIGSLEDDENSVVLCRIPSTRKFMKYAILITVIYNLIFIPL